MKWFEQARRRSGAAAEPSWYAAQDSRKHVRQVVLNVPASSEVPPQVANLVPPGDHSAFASQPWAAITLLMPPPNEGPIVFARAEGVAQRLRGCPIRFAFSFYQMNAGGLLTTLIHVDCPEIEKPSGKLAVFENHHNVSQADACERVQRLINRGRVDVCFTASGQNGPCTGYFGVSAAVPQECQDALLEEWQQLLRYDRSLEASHGSFQQAVGQYERENPVQENPVLAPML